MPERRNNELKIWYLISIERTRRMKGDKWNVMQLQMESKSRMAMRGNRNDCLKVVGIIRNGRAVLLMDGNLLCWIEVTTCSRKGMSVQGLRPCATYCEIYGLRLLF